MKKELLKIFDYGVLKPFLSREEIIKICEEAKTYSKYIATISVSPSNVSLVTNLLKGSGIKVCATIAFPFGATPIKIKIKEALTAIKDGANEIDVVLNIGAIKSHDFKYVEKEIKSIVKKIKKTYPNVIIKAILETPYLTKEEKIETCKIVESAGVDLIKTSTGFVDSQYKNSLGINQIDDIKLFKQITKKVGIKASGGIRDLDTVLELIKAGATRVGTSTPIPIIQEIKKKLGE